MTDRAIELLRSGEEFVEKMRAEVARQAFLALTDENGDSTVGRHTTVAVEGWYASDLHEALIRAVKEAYSTFPFEVTDTSVVNEAHTGKSIVHFVLQHYETHVAASTNNLQLAA